MNKTHFLTDFSNSVPDGEESSEISVGPSCSTTASVTSSSYDESEGEDRWSLVHEGGGGRRKKRTRKKAYMLSKNALAKQKKSIVESTSSSESDGEPSSFFELPTTEGIPSDLYEEEDEVRPTILLV